MVSPPQTDTSERTGGGTRGRRGHDWTRLRTLRKFLNRRRNVSRHSSEGSMSFLLSSPVAPTPNMAGASGSGRSGISYGFTTRVVWGSSRASRLYRGRHCEQRLSVPSRLCRTTVTYERCLPNSEQVLHTIHRHAIERIREVRNREDLAPQHGLLLVLIV